VKPAISHPNLEVYCGDALDVLSKLPDESVQMCVTSPPYWGLRDYGVEGQLGIEKTPEEFIAKMVAVFAEVRRVLKKDGTAWVNMGDCYAGSWGAQSRGNKNGEDSSTIEGASMLSARQILAHPKGTHTGSVKNTPGLKPKDLVGIPWMLAFALRADGWYLRQDIIWAKPNPMPESITDRCTKAHEYVFLLSKSQRYFYDAEAIKEPASYNTHERVSRAQLEHKSMPDEKRNGIRPKMPAGWAQGDGPPHTAIGHQVGVHRKSRKSWRGSDDGKNAEVHPNVGKNRIKNNESFDEAMAEMPDDRNKRSVWTIASSHYPEAHFATYPPDLIKPCILAGSRPGDTVLDPFGGSGTSGQVALELGRRAILIELNPKYIPLIDKRTLVTPGLNL
jgi:DNA modification methylase